MRGIVYSSGREAIAMKSGATFHIEWDGDLIREPVMVVTSKDKRKRAATPKFNLKDIPGGMDAFKALVDSFLSYSEPSK